MSGTVKPYRVAVMTKQLDNWTSGSGHHLNELMHHVLDLNDGTFDFTFVHYRKSENGIYSRVREMIVPRNPIVASRILSLERFDIIHYTPLSIYAPIWGIRARRTATVHGIEEVLYPEGYTLIQRMHELILQPAYMRRMDGIATVSQASKKYFTERYHVKSDRVFITTNGIGAAYRRLSEAELAGIRLPVPEKPYVLHISRFSMRKNPVNVINGFASFVRDTGLDCNLVCAGKGWDGEEARALARKAGITDRFVTPGFITEEEAVGLLNKASVFVFPSFAEGFGMPNVEAMACGCPVITSGIFAIPEIVGDAAHVLEKVDDPDETGKAIARVVTDSAYRELLVARGFERIKRYNWDDSARSIMSYWKGLLDHADIMNGRLL